MENGYVDEQRREAIHGIQVNYDICLMWTSQIKSGDI